ncbi:unnamed protein product [Leuciscus chuanchicus]
MSSLPPRCLALRTSSPTILSVNYTQEPEILSVEPNKVSFHGRNNILLRGKNLESVIKIHIQGDLDCISKESPVFDRSSDTLRFHIPPSGTKGTVKVCVVTPDDRDDTVTMTTCGGRKIHVEGSNMEFVESVIFQDSDEVIRTHYNRSAGVECWKHHCGLCTVCVQSYKPDPEFTGFTTLRVANDLQVNIKKNPDALTLSMSEVNVTGLQGDQQYQCVLEKIESKAIICKIKGESGAVTAVDSITISRVGDSGDLMTGKRPEGMEISQNPRLNLPSQIRLAEGAPQAVTTSLRRPNEIYVQE